MIVYFDTSGLLKPLPEAVATIARRQRRGDIPLAAAQALVSDVETFRRASTVGDLDEARAAGLAFGHGLRGFDAIQLAEALTTRAIVGARRSRRAAPP